MKGHPFIWIALAFVAGAYFAPTSLRNALGK